MADDNTQPPAPETPPSGEIDFDQQPAEVKALFQKLLDDKRQANKEALETKRKLREYESAREKAEHDALTEQSQFKTLYEKEKQAREKVESEANVRMLGLLREKIGLKAGLPEALIPRLQGTTEEELLADAESLKAALPQSTPKTPVSGTQNNTTPVPRGTPAGKTDEQIDAWLRNKDNSRSSSEPRQDGDTLIFGG